MYVVERERLFIRVNYIKFSNQFQPFNHVLISVGKAIHTSSSKKFIRPKLHAVHVKIIFFRELSPPLA